jgi:GNAT superfamily N-acetyltransferase
MALSERDKGDRMDPSEPATDIEISTDRSRIDVHAVHAFLTSSYWAQGRSLETVEASLQNSLCFGAYLADRQVAFGRAITDSSTFAYLADIFVFPDYRRRGISKMLVRAMVAHPQLQGTGLLLRTRDAHGLYEQFGFRAPKDPSTLMVLPNGPEVVASARRHAET